MLNPAIEASQEPHRAGHIIENQKRLFIVQNRIIVSQASIIAHVIEGLKDRNAGFQDAVGHLGFNMAGLAQALYAVSVVAPPSCIRGPRCAAPGYSLAVAFGTVGWGTAGAESCDQGLERRRGGRREVAAPIFCSIGLRHMAGLDQCWRGHRQ